MGLVASSSPVEAAVGGGVDAVGATVAVLTTLASPFLRKIKRAVCGFSLILKCRWIFTTPT